jgi:capsular polysaccharide biosynthesis protein
MRDEDSSSEMSLDDSAAIIVALLIGVFIIFFLTLFITGNLQDEIPAHLQQPVLGPETGNRPP